MTSKDNTEKTVKETQDNKQAGPRIMLGVDESRMSTSYANAFRTFQTADELIIDFGLNTVAALPPDARDADGAMLLTINNRVIMNYQNAKRLAGSLGNIIRAYEQKFGEIRLQGMEP